MLDKLKSQNPHIEICSCKEREFASYGRIVEDIDFAPLIEYADKNAVLGEGVAYERSIAELEAYEVKNTIQNTFFGEQSIQIGWCIGFNNRLNAVEYHKSSELFVAVTDVLLLLGKQGDIDHNTYDSSRIRGFVVPRGTAVELYSTTLHFAPIHTGEKGFKALIILPSMTNAPLSRSYAPEGLNGEAKLLFANNKWLIAHSDSKPARNGAYVGIIGNNIEIHL